MIQNKYTFNQSSVELEISGLPDYSLNDNKENISILSGWKLSIINQPEIEGGIDHLKSVISAFYECASLALRGQDETVESKLIDLKLDKYGFYNITLKSTKSEVKPLKLRIGCAEFSDIINCFDQLKSSTNIKIDLNNLTSQPKINNSLYLDRSKLFTNFIPPVIALISIAFFALISTYFYENKDNRDNNISILNNILISNINKTMIKI